MAVNPTTVTSLSQGDVTTVVPIITTMAKAYTRGRGFSGNEPNDEIAAVITTAAARLAANGKQASYSSTAGSFAQDLRTYFTGWTLTELAVLNRYRVRAQ
ncbi:hypothetical protein [Mycolicibacterium bacteremicum]|uniref:hypothetical protein n=1 Tax=Mycolicibacterium bacteremicum TaxID=564198 RepID=UPI0026F14B61|nr:hypothetical protein [Mycolicibacterium bacteremicum]